MQSSPEEKKTKKKNNLILNKDLRFLVVMFFEYVESAACAVTQACHERHGWLVRGAFEREGGSWLTWMLRSRLGLLTILMNKSGWQLLLLLLPCRHLLVKLVPVSLLLLYSLFCFWVICRAVQNVLGAMAIRKVRLVLSPSVSIHETEKWRPGF